MQPSRILPVWEDGVLVWRLPPKGYYSRGFYAFEAFGSTTFRVVSAWVRVC